MSDSDKPKVLYRRPAPYLQGEAFAGDLLNRKQLGEQLIAHVARLSDGGVLAVTAPWGSGKTWFAANLHHALRAQGQIAGYIDAFQVDHVDDPFLVLSGALVEIIQGGQGGPVDATLRDRAKRLAFAAIPIGAKLAAKGASKLLTGLDLSDALSAAIEAGADSAGDQSEAAIRKSLEAFQARKRTVEAFHAAMTEAARAATKPVVLLIDELDRCQPSFAVQLIERMKHYFDVPNLVFVLFVNREQLEASIKGVYGEHIDARGYLSKFVHFFLTLPTSQRSSSEWRSYLSQFIARQATEYGLDKNRRYDLIASSMIGLAEAFGMSLRDIERTFGLLSMAGRFENAAPLVAYLASIKTIKPDLFGILIRGNAVAHGEVARVIHDLSWSQEDSWLRDLLLGLHEACQVGRQSMPVDRREPVSQFLQEAGGMEPYRLFAKWSRAMDLYID